MTRVSLAPFRCPACPDGKQVMMEVDDEKIQAAKRFPTPVTAKCTRGHALVVFVDRDLRVVDVQTALSVSEGTKDAVERAKGWFETL
ncbi:MAG: hypothetical protein HXY34_03645 [Candidatus Thorarchaeota archaeon]|nr:hypothetical protein [Candidatus Thorarchaeota archaeon]